MRNRLRITRKTFLAALLAASLAASLLGSGFSQSLRNSVQVFLAPLGDAGMYVATSISARTGSAGMRPISPAEARRLDEQIETLQMQVEGLRRELLRTRRELAQIQEIRRSPAFAPLRDVPLELIPARVVGADALPYSQGRVVNVGREGGASNGQAVTTRLLLLDRSKALPTDLRAIVPYRRLQEVTGCALAGRLVETGAFTARLQLVTSRDYKMAARILRQPDGRLITSGRAKEALTATNNALIDVVAEGDGAGGMVVRQVSADHAVRPGDWLVTRDDDAQLPVQLRVGTVTAVQDDPKRPRWLVTLTVKPQADLDALREVFVVRRLGANGPGGE